MAQRYTVFNPDGEEIETPSERHARQKELMSLQQRGQPQQQHSGGYGGGGGAAQSTALRDDPFFANGGGGASFQDQVEAKKLLMRERVAGDLALGQQGGDFGLQGIDKQQGGQTERANIANEIPREQLGFEKDRYADIRDSVTANSAADAASGRLRAGVFADMNNGAGGFTNEQKLVAIGRDPRMARDPAVERRQRMEEAQATAYADAEPERGPEIMGLLNEGRLSEYAPTKRIDTRSIDESTQATELPEVQQAMMGMADYVSSVSVWWSPANIGYVRDKIAATKAALDGARVSPAAAAMVMKRVNNLIQNAIDAEGWDADGADKIREMIGLSPAGGLQQKHVTRGLMATNPLTLPFAAIDAGFDYMNE